MISITGSYGEGGGQILRTSLALASLLETPVRITKIRANRPRPGLANQHLACIKALQTITDAEVKGAKLGSTEIEFHPGKIHEGSFKIDIGTAGSISLVLQALSLPCGFTGGKIKLTITGGTDVSWSPPVDYVKNVSYAMLEKMGYKASLNLIKRGYYPRGNGMVEVEFFPAKRLRGIRIERGKLVEVEGVAHSLNLPCHIVEREAKAAQEILPCRVELECRKNFSTGTGITLWAIFEGSVLGANSLGERGKPAEKVGREAALQLREEIESEASLDVHMADQIIPFLAVAEGISHFTVRKITKHLETNIYIVEKIVGNKFEIEKRDGLYRVKTRGVGFKV